MIFEHFQKCSYLFLQMYSSYLELINGYAVYPSVVNLDKNNSHKNTTPMQLWVNDPCYYHLRHM